MPGERHYALLGELSIAKLGQAAMPAGRQREIIGQFCSARGGAHTIARGPQQGRFGRRRLRVLAERFGFHEDDRNAETLETVEIIRKLRESGPSCASIYERD
jgi:hypothetical protein